MRSRKPEPICIPQEAKPSYSLTNNGVFTEGDIIISRDGCFIGNTESPASTRPSSRSSNCSIDASRVASGAIEDATCKQLDEITLPDLLEVGIIGSGSSGVVHKVNVKSTGHPLVRKVIPFDVHCDKKREQVCNELQILYKAASPYIVKYYQSFFDNGAITIVMEYLDGGSLADLVKIVKVIPEQYLAEVARQVLKGLQYLHRDLKVIHRDIKPSNLLLSSRGEIKISDFGVSHQLNNSVSECKSWVGTVTYMSPERINGGTYSFDCDIWSLGLTLVECALGRFPYPPTPPGESAAPLIFWDLLDHIVHQPPPLLRAGDFSEQCCSFMELCLRKEPKRRATAAELLDHPWLAMHSEVSLADIIVTPKTHSVGSG